MKGVLLIATVLATGIVVADVPFKQTLTWCMYEEQEPPLWLADFFKAPEWQRLPFPPNAPHYKVALDVVGSGEMKYRVVIPKDDDSLLIVGQCDGPVGYIEKDMYLTPDLTIEIEGGNYGVPFTLQQSETGQGVWDNVHSKLIPID